MSRETEKVLNPEIMKQTQSLVTFEKTDDILQDMRGIIDSSRDAAYRAVNVTLDVYKRQALERHCFIQTLQSVAFLFEDSPDSVSEWL